MHLIIMELIVPMMRMKGMLIDMAKYLVNYYETYTNSYEIEADSKEEAEEKLILEIGEGSLNPPEECFNSWCDIKEMEDD